MCWSKPKVSGDLPPPRRAHSATMVDKRLFVFAGGDGPNYFNDLYIFDTISLRWTRPEVYGQTPSPRRAHTANYFDGQLIIFGGGNGVGALNDVHTLDLNDLDRLEWRKSECSELDKVYNLPDVPLLFVQPGGRRDEARDEER